MSRPALTEDHFLQFFDIESSGLSEKLRNAIAASNFSYIPLENPERDKTILQVLKRISSPALTIAGKDAKDRWERGWNENLKEFVDSDYDMKKLLPKFIRPNTTLRLLGNYVKPVDPDFELNYYAILREWLFEYFSATDAIYEFGCGTGFNLVALAERYPEKNLYGLDWVSAPEEIIRLLAEKYHYKMEGGVFDMFSPDRNLQLKENSGILMIGALEQLGSNFSLFLNYIREQKPKIVVQVNHLIELYDQEDLLDYLAFEFEQKRNYLKGYLPELQKLEKEGKVEILKLRRAHFGSLFHDGYSIVVWRPR